MLKLSENYSKQLGQIGSIGYFDLIGDKLSELELFLKEYGNLVFKQTLNDEERVNKKIAFKINFREMVETRANRINLTLTGKREQSEKEEFLEHFTVDGIRAIIYATNFCPEQLSIGEYAGMLISTFDRFGIANVDAFGLRILEIAQPKTIEQYEIVCNQIKMIINLLSVSSPDLAAPEGLEEMIDGFTASEINERWQAAVGMPLEVAEELALSEKFPESIEEINNPGEYHDPRQTS